MRIVNEVVLNQVLVAVGDADTTKSVVARIQDDGVLWLGGTTFHGTPALRISVSGWSTRDADADRSVDAILAAVDAVRTQRVSSQLASGWMVTLVIATGSFGRSRASRGAETIRSTTSRPLVTCPKSV